MNGSSLFSNKLTNVAMPCLKENSENSNVNDGKNSQVDCSLINTCSRDDEVSSNDMNFEMKSEIVGVLEEKGKNFIDDIECQPSPNLSDVDSSHSVIQTHDEEKSSPVSSDIADHEVDSSSSVIQSHDEHKSSPVSSDLMDHEVDSSNSLVQSHDEQKSGLVSSNIMDQTEHANPCPLLTKDLNSPDTSFNFKDDPKNSTGSVTFSDHVSNSDLRSQHRVQMKQGRSELIDSLSFDDKLEEISSTDLEKSQNMKVRTESNFLIAENQNLFKDPKDNERMVVEYDTEMEQYKEAISKETNQENEKKSTDKDLFTKVDTIDNNLNSNKVFHETLSCLNSCKDDDPELINAGINSCANQIVVLESVSLSNTENISSDISENISLFEVHGLQNSEESSSFKSEENANLAKDGRPNSVCLEDCPTPDYPAEVDKLQNSEDSYSQRDENTNSTTDERPNSSSGGDCMKPDNAISPPDLCNSNTEVLNNETENEMAWLSIEEFKDGLIETISTSTSETMFEASLIDTKEGIQCKEIYPISCKDEKNISPYTKFGLKSCRVHLGDSRISHKLLKSMEDPFSNKPNFNRLKRKLEIMLISGQKEEDKTMRQLKKMRNDKSVVLQDILKEIQKIKKKFRV